MLMTSPAGITHVGYGDADDKGRPSITHCGRTISSHWTVANDEVQRNEYPTCRSCLHAGMAAPHLRHVGRNALVCPACKGGMITAYFQTVVEVQPSGRMGIIDGPTDDDFLNAGCSNLECYVEIKQEPGDGRLRRALIYVDADNDEPWERGKHGDEALWEGIRAAYIDAVTELLRRQR